MKLVSVIAILGLCVGSSDSCFSQSVTVYDNGVSLVNDGRVNDPNFPIFLMHADRFSLASSAQINQIDWLGAYKNGNLLPDADDGFTIHVFGFDAGIPATTAFGTYYVGSGQRQFTAQTLLYGNPVFSYSASIPTITLGAGNYLLSIMNTHVGTKQWMWADAEAGPGNSYLMFEGTPWMEYSGGGVAEFAFSLSYVPEPSVATLIGLGCLLLGGLRLHTHSRRNR